MKNSANKFNARKVTWDGITFDSQKEAFRYQFLKQLEASGEVEDLEVHKRIPVIDKSPYGREIVYIADFVYYDHDGKKHIEDVKGYRGGSVYAHFKIKKRLVAERYGIVIEEI